MTVCEARMAVRENGKELRNVGLYQDNEDVVLEAVRQFGCALKYASDRLKGDKRIVLEAVKQDPYAIHYADIRFYGDVDVMTEAVRQRPPLLSYAHPAIRFIVKKKAE